jgi:hypothetical protein
VTAAVISEPMSEEAALLGELYGTDKSLALSISAALALQRSPEIGTDEVNRHLEECARAVAEHRGELAEHFGACRDAAADLAALAGEVDGNCPPSQRRLDAVRASHRRLRRMVWEVFDCEYVPCGHERKH